MDPKLRTELPNSEGRNPTFIDDEYYRDNYGAMYEDNQKLFKRH